MKKLASFLVILLTVSPMTGHAHTGVSAVHGLLDGFVHPLIGVDHLLVMLAVGLWSAMQAGKALWLLPVVFLSAMIAGAMMALAGLPFESAENWVATSVIVAGVLVGRHLKIPLLVAGSLIAVCAISHGYVHAKEITLGVSAWAYASGFMLTTAMLLGIGLVVGVQAATRIKILATGFGVLCAMVGLGLLVVG